MWILISRNYTYRFYVVIYCFIRQNTALPCRSKLEHTSQDDVRRKAEGQRQEAKNVDATFLEYALQTKKVIARSLASTIRMFEPSAFLCDATA